MTVGKYADTIHFQTILAIKNAFEDFNRAICNTENGMWLESPTIQVLDEAGEPFATVFYCDGEAFVEPHFDLVRDITDR